MEVLIQRDEETADLLVALLIAEALRKKPDLVLGLATGRTMEPVYAHLVRMHTEEGLNFSACRTFNLDEYIGLTVENPNSYHYFMNEHLFSRVNIKLKNTHVPDGVAEDLDGECQRYEESMRECGGIDLQLLGIGRSGHIGFNEPLSALRSRTRCKALTPVTIEQNSPLFDDPDEMPKRAITMGVGTILDAKRCLLLVTGAEKAEILHRAVEGPVTSMISASALQWHERCTAIVDQAAAAELEGREYYQWIWEHEPEWREFREQLA
jgi:glucosamine-6-phosphate deaminase